MAMVEEDEARSSRVYEWLKELINWVLEWIGAHLPTRLTAAAAAAAAGSDHLTAAAAAHPALPPAAAAHRGAPDPLLVAPAAPLGDDKSTILVFRLADPHHLLVRHGESRSLCAPELPGSNRRLTRADVVSFDSGFILVQLEEGGRYGVYQPMEREEVCVDVRIPAWLGQKSAEFTTGGIMNCPNTGVLTIGLVDTSGRVAGLCCTDNGQWQGWRTASALELPGEMRCKERRLMDSRLILGPHGLELVVLSVQTREVLIVNFEAGLEDLRSTCRVLPPPPRVHAGLLYFTFDVDRGHNTGCNTGCGAGDHAPVVCPSLDRLKYAPVVRLLAVSPHNPVFTTWELACPDGEWCRVAGAWNPATPSLHSHLLRGNKACEESSNRINSACEIGGKVLIFVEGHSKVYSYNVGENEWEEPVGILPGRGRRVPDGYALHLLGA